MFLSVVPRLSRVVCQLTSQCLNHSPSCSRLAQSHQTKDGEECDAETVCANADLNEPPRDRPTDRYRCSDAVSNVSEKVLTAHFKVCSERHAPFLPPDVPVFCCGSGCANCVFIQYATEMAECFNDNGTSALKVVDALDDENLKAFLRVEIECLLKK